MELLQKTQTARMVLAYLYDQQLEPLAQQFCRKCPYLEEERRLLEIGDIPVRPFYRPLVQIFCEFNRMYMQSLTLISQYENQVTFPNALSELDKIDIIIELNRTYGISCLQNITNLGASQVHNKSNNVASYPRQVATKPCADTTIVVRQSTSENGVRESNGPPQISSGANMSQSLPRKEICTASEQTVNLNQEEIMTLLKCGDRGKENEEALSYLLHQGHDEQNTYSNLPAPANNQPAQEINAPMPHHEPSVPTVMPPPVQQTDNPHSFEVSSVFAVPSTDHVQQRPETEQPSHSNETEEHVLENPSNVDNSIIPPPPPPVVCSTVGIDVLTKEDGATGMKEIVAARILGSMAKSGFGRSEPANDTPPGNPIVNDSVGGTRSSSSRKRSHIRILDFGTPAPKRAGSVPSSVENTRAREAGTGSHTRRLFPGQGTPAYGDGNASSSDASTIPAGALTLSAAIAEGKTTSDQQSQAVHVIPHDEPSSRKEPQHESQPHVNQPTISVTSTVASVETVVSSTDTAAAISQSQPPQDVQKSKNVPNSPPSDFRLPPAPKPAAQPQKSTILKDAGEPPQIQKRTLPRAIAATAEKKPRPLERTHSGTSWPSTASTSKGVQDHALDDKKKKSTPLKRQHSFSSRMATRSSTKLTVSDRVRSEVTSLISKLPTKESVLLKSVTKQQQQQEATAGTIGLRSHSSTASELLYTINLEHTETPYKIDPLAEFPMTPRFLSDPMLSISKLDSSTFSGAFFRGAGSGVMSETADINTPGFPITPGTLSTPQSQPSPARNVVSYYRPDEGGGMQPPDELLQPAAASAEQRDPRSRAPSECASEGGSDKMEIVAGDSVFVISFSPLIEMYEQKPTQC